MTEIEARERPDPIPAMILSVMSIAKRYHEEKVRSRMTLWIAENVRGVPNDTPLRMPNAGEVPMR